jgi:hypothetical protein
MNMDEIIRKRKSIRKYDPTKLDAATLEKVRDQIAKITPLYPDIHYSVEIADKTKRAIGINAPHRMVSFLFYLPTSKIIIRIRT